MEQKTDKREWKFHMASQDSEGGILRCHVDEAGTIHTDEFTPIAGCCWMAREGNRLHALLREPFQQQSGVQSYDVDGAGNLTPVGDTVPTHGSVAAHLLAWRDHLYCANYLSGTVVQLPDRVQAYSGHGPVKDRQPCSHPHCIVPFPGEDRLAVTDLGTDRIMICTPELETLSVTQMPAGSGPRHLVFSPDGRYAFCSLEMGNAVAVLAVEDGGLHLMDCISVLPEQWLGWASASAIRLSEDGMLLYVSARGPGSICVFRVEGGSLRRLGFVECGEGQHIREFAFVGPWLLCADEKGHTVSVFPEDDAIARPPVSVYPAKRVWCILPSD